MPKIEAVGDEGLVFDSQEFNTDETDSGRRWIGGEIIYQQTWAIQGPEKLSSGGNVGIRDTPHGLTDHDLVIEVRGYLTNGNYTMPIPSPMGAQASPTGLDGATGRRTVSVLVDDTNIKMYAGQDLTDYNGYVMLLYTKT